MAGVSRLLILLTSRARAEPASSTPLLQRKLARILEAEDLIEGSHDYKAASRSSTRSRRTSCSPPRPRTCAGRSRRC